MKLTKRQFFKMSIVAPALGMAIGLSVLTSGEPTLSKHHVGLVEDWSSHHLIFSNPGTYEQAIANGTYSKWINLRYNTRFIMQQERRRAEAASTSGFSRSMLEAFKLAGNPPVLGGAPPKGGGGPPKKGKKGLQKDWSEPLLTGAVLPNTFPAKWSFNTTGTPDCTNDFVVYPTGSSGSATSATIIAYNNLYATTCSSGSVPSVYWAYNTGAGTVTTSPTISLDGTQVAFVQNTSTGAELVVLKWAASGGSATSPAYTLTSNPSYPSCTAPCMIAVPFSGSPSDTYSSPFYDYEADDALYVGDDISKLHKFTPVFNGTPAELVGVYWPATLNYLSGPSYSYPVSSPVWDPASGCVFVGDTYGYFYAASVGSPSPPVCSGSPGVYFAENLGASGVGDGIFDAPLVDSTAEREYVFVAGSAGTIGNCGTAGGNCVYQFHFDMLTNEQGLGTGGVYYPLYAGTFDNVYYSSGSTTPSGSLYVVGNTGAGATLYQVPISSNAMGTPVSAVTGLSSTDYAWASPVTEFCNNGASACAVTSGATTSGTDYIFFSVYYGNVAGCSKAAGTGCVLAYNVSTGTPSIVGELPTGAPGGNGCFSTGAFIIDNSSASTGASQVYFVNLEGNSPAAAPGACGSATGNIIDAVQAAQSGL